MRKIVDRFDARLDVLPAAGDAGVEFAEMVGKYGRLVWCYHGLDWNEAEI